MVLIVINLIIIIIIDLIINKEFKKALDIMSESKILKIEVVLPYITNTITIDDFKLKVSKCINEYEINI